MQNISPITTSGISEKKLINDVATRLYIFWKNFSANEIAKEETKMWR